MLTRVSERIFRDTLLPESTADTRGNPFIFEILRDLCVLCGEKSGLVYPATECGNRRVTYEFAMHTSHVTPLGMTRCPCTKTARFGHLPP